MKISQFLLVGLFTLCLALNVSAQTPDTLKENIQYENGLRKFEKGELDYSGLPFLVTVAKRKHNNELANRIALDYIDNYLLKLTEKELYTKDNLLYIIGNLQTSESKAFRMFYNQQDRINSIIGQPDAANSLIRYVIYIEEIAPAIKYGQKDKKAPDWKKINKLITSKYNSALADRTVLESKSYWFSLLKDQAAYAHTLVQRVEKYGPFGMFGQDSQYNQIAWDIFCNTGNKSDLQKALAWSDGSVKATNNNYSMGVHLDTYANILYRLGRKKEALATEERAIQTTPDNHDIQENFKKMKSGLPTWTK